MACSELGSNSAAADFCGQPKALILQLASAIARDSQARYRAGAGWSSEFRIGQPEGLPLFAVKDLPASQYPCG